MQQIFKKIIDVVAIPVTNKIKKFKDQHKGESCYIFGDGASIKFFDLNSFPKKPAFSLSCLPFHKDAYVLNFRYKLLIQPFYFYPYYKTHTSIEKKWLRHKIKDKYIELFKNNNRSDCFISLSNYPVLRGDNIFHLFNTINDKDSDFLNECRHNQIDIYKGSLLASISLAIYMGFKEIVLVGCDYTHKKSRVGHWYEKGRGVFEPHKNYEKNFLNIARKYANIFTITMDDVGSVLPGITYKEFTGNDLIYRENIEILDIEILKLLNMWPDYKIF